MIKRLLGLIELALIEGLVVPVGPRDPLIANELRGSEVLVGLLGPDRRALEGDDSATASTAR